MLDNCYWSVLKFTDSLLCHLHFPVKHISNSKYFIFCSWNFHLALKKINLISLLKFPFFSFVPSTLQSFISHSMVIIPTLKSFKIIPALWSSCLPHTVLLEICSHFSDSFYVKLFWIGFWTFWILCCVVCGFCCIASNTLGAFIFSR